MPEIIKKTRLGPIGKALLFIGLAVALTGFLSAEKPVVQEEDMETCGECHEELAAAAVIQPHGAAKSCSSCHTGGKIHMEEGGGVDNIFAFKDTDVPNAKSKACLTCHIRHNGKYFASPHGKAALDCTTCHTIHDPNPKPMLLNAGSSKSCAACHADVFAKFQLNERHRLQEGILSCASCHDPHEPGVRERLGGFKHESCLKCHTAQGGPYLYEHGASRIEGCSACHEVHGSPNRHMLKYQSISDLCFSCHTFAPSFHSRFNSETSNCATCHPTIHGSNLSKIFLK